MKIEKNCENCNNIFLADKREVSRGDARFCSISCGATSRVYIKTFTRVCNNCTKEFLAASNEAIYCSKPCKSAFYRKRQKDKDYKSTKTIKTNLLQTSCEICGWNETTTDLHHILPVSEGGKNNLKNLIVVCPNHHRMIHHNLISQDKLLQIVNNREIDV